MARTAPLSHFHLPAGSATLRRAGRGSPLGALLYVLSVIGAATLKVLTPLAKGCYSAIIEAQQRRADHRVWEIAESDPRLKAELIALRDHAASRN